MKKQKYFKAACSGNYSNNYGWDDGMSVNNIHPVEIQDVIEEDFHGNPMGMFDTKKIIQSYNYNDYNSSRSCSYIIYASSIEEAKNILQEHLDTVYTVIKYDGGGMRL